MPKEAKQTPAKSCEWCGSIFTRGRLGKNNQLECVANYMRRKFCSISCSVKRQHATEPPTAAASRKRAKKQLQGQCESCGWTVDLCIHHVNGNPMDNSASNLQTLCMNCHSYWHATHKRLGKPCLTPMPRLIE